MSGIGTELDSCFNRKISRQAPAEKKDIISMRRTSAVLSRFTWNEIEAGWTPRLDSWRCSQKAMGFE